MKDQFRQKVYLTIFFLRRKQGGVLFKGATCMYTKAKKIFHFLRCVLNEGATFSAEITVVESKASDNLEGQLYYLFIFSVLLYTRFYKF